MISSSRSGTLSKLCSDKCRRLIAGHPSLHRWACAAARGWRCKKLISRFTAVIILIFASLNAVAEPVYRPTVNGGVVLNEEWRSSKIEACHSTVGLLHNSTSGRNISGAYMLEDGVTCVIVRLNQNPEIAGLETSDDGCTTGEEWDWLNQQCALVVAPDGSTELIEVYLFVTLLMGTLFGSFFIGWRMGYA